MSWKQKVVLDDLRVDWLHSDAILAMFIAPKQHR